MLRRPRRNRKSSAVRNIVQENWVTTNDLLFPLFLLPGENKQEAITSMPGIFRFSLDLLLKEIESCLALGIQAFAVFPCLPETVKDSFATESTNKEGLYIKSLERIKTEFPEAFIMTDVAMDPYSSDGHDGLVKKGEILNDESVEILVNMALAQAETGVDMLGPSDMMDGRIGAIRGALDKKGFTQTGIISYSAKYASAYYGPFRDALDSAPKFGDKKTYQMNPANSAEALIEAELDIEEGADIIMVKPGLPYLDIIKSLKDTFETPIAAYNVSGEYAMLKAAAEKGWLNNDQAIAEQLLSFKRAGSDLILTYFAKEAAQKGLVG